MQIGAELAGWSLPFHCCHHAIANDERADVGCVGLPDELLYEDVNVCALKRLDHRFRRLHRLAEHYAYALRAFQQLDHYRNAADEIDDVLRLLGVVGVGGDGKSDAAASKQLQAA